MQGEEIDDLKRICFVCSKRVSADQWEYQQFKNSMKQFIACHKCMLEADQLNNAADAMPHLAPIPPTIKSPDTKRMPGISKFNWFLIGYSAATILDWLLGLMYPGK